MKFGGTSVASKERWETIAKIIRSRREEGANVLVVCSALSGVSNQLEAIIARIHDGQSVDEGLQELRDKHYALCQSLGVDTAIADPLLNSLEQLVRGVELIGLLTDEIRARLMAHGELLSTTIGQSWLGTQDIKAGWRDARDLLIPVTPPVEATQSRRYLSASCSSEFNPELLAELNGAAEPVLITQGFIARNEYGRTVLLGRGGSDTSGAYFAAQLGAERLEIWTDVPGMFTANPKDRPDARLLRLIGYEEAQVMVAMGARVLHPRCIRPVAESNIPLHVRCTLSPDHYGTVISNEAEAQNQAPHVKALTTRSKLFMVRIYCPGNWHIAGLLGEVTNVFKRHGLSIDLISNSPQNVTITMDPAVTPLGPIEESNLLRDLEEFGELSYHQDVGSVSLVGTQINTVINKLADGLKGMTDSNIHMVSQATTDSGLTFVVDPDDVQRVMDPLHDWLLAGDLPETVFGPGWQDLVLDDN